MNGKMIAGAFSIICLFGIFAFGRQSQFVQNIFQVNNQPIGIELPYSQPHYHVARVTDEMAYEQLFRLLLRFEKQATKQMNEGNQQRADFLRNYLQRKAGLTLEQTNALKTYAQNFTTQLGCRNNPGDMMNQTPVEHRPRVIQLLGESGFDKFDKFVREKITPRIIYSRDSKTQTASFGMSFIDYDYDANEVLAYSYTEEPPGHCQTVTNIVTATLTSSTEGMVDSDAAEVCDGSAEVSLYFSNPNPEDEICIDGEHQFARTYYQMRDNKTSGLFDNSSHDLMGGGSCYYEKTESLPPSEDCLVTPSLPNVTSVTFQLIQQGSTGIDTNPNAEGGQRIFPDDDTPGDTVNRQLIRVTASISESRAGVRIYFGNFDLDDPSSDPVIDTNGNTGDDNNGAVNNNSAGHLASTSALTNSSGVASVNFTVTRQPGDNFAIAAGVDQNAVSGVTVNGTALMSGGGASIDVNCDGTDLVCRSEMLTVWRRLHIEADSMNESQGNFVNGNFAETRRVNAFDTEVQVNTSQQLEVNRFQNGRLVSGSRNLRVTSNTATSVTVRTFFGATVRVNQGETFQLYDDDDFNDTDGTNLDGDSGEDIPLRASDLALLTANSDDPTANILAPVYIRPVYDVVDPRDNSFFQINAFGLEQADTRALFLDRDLTTTNTDVEFWTVYILGAYQSALIADNDPALESIYAPNFGIADGIPTTFLGDGRGVLIFQEAHSSKEIIHYPNDPSDPSLRQVATTVGHEIGHLLSGQHGDGDIMTNGFGLLTSNQFSPTTVRRIRAELLHP